MQPEAHMAPHNCKRRPIPHIQYHILGVFNNTICLFIPGFCSGKQLTSGVFESPVHFNQPPRSERKIEMPPPSIIGSAWVHHAGPSDGANLFLLWLAVNSIKYALCLETHAQTQYLDGATLRTLLQKRSFMQHWKDKNMSAIQPSDTHANDVLTVLACRIKGFTWSP